MNSYEIVYFKGNPTSGTIQQHQRIDRSIIKIIGNYNYLVLDSEDKNLSGKSIAKAKVYIGFSRGSRYLNKLDPTTLKISIGGVSGAKVHRFTNKDDRVLKGDVSFKSLGAHFIIEETDKLKIKSLIDNFLENL